MKKTTPTIVLTGAGSGGHITPLLSLARELKSQDPDCQIVYVGHKGDNFDTFRENSHDFDFKVFINAGKFRRYHGQSLLFRLFDVRTIALNIRDLFRLPGSIVASVRLLRRFRPRVVFSKGSFVALPVGIAARLLRIPIITHDSDAMPGLANRIVGRWAALHATGMPAKYYQYPKQTIDYVGIPLDARIKKVTPKIQADFRHQLGLPADAMVLLLSGGGNGSARLNDLMISISSHLLHSNLSLHILHVCGPAHEKSVKDSYKLLLPQTEHKRVKVTGFVSDFYAYAGAADLIITRAGATTLAELAVAAKACIIIPGPFLAGGHQLMNAEDLAKRDAAVVADNDIDPDELLVMVSELLGNDHRRWELARNLFATARPDAASRLADIILKTALRHEL